MGLQIDILNLHGLVPHPHRCLPEQSDLWTVTGVSVRTLLCVMAQELVE